MTKIELREHLLELPEYERLEIADALWTSLGDPDLLPVPEWQQSLLAERLATSEDDPGVDWEEFRASLRS